MRLLPFAILALFVAAPRSASADDSTSFLRTWRLALERELARAALANRPAPPEPVEVRYQARKLGLLTLPAPVLAAESVDLNGDSKGELLLLTARSLHVVSLLPKVALDQSIALPDKPAAIRSRDPIGSLVVTGDAGEWRVLARTSDQAVGLELGLKQGLLQPTGEVDGFPLCARATMKRVVGRNYFAAAGVTWADEEDRLTLPEEFYSARCHRFVDELGYPSTVFTVVSLDRELRSDCRRQRDGKKCAVGPAVGRTYQDTGVAHLVTDVDRDGSPEVVVTRGTAPGQPDRVSVFSKGRKGRVFSKEFSGGVVALAAPDLDGDGTVELVAGVGRASRRQLVFWSLN